MTTFLGPAPETEEGIGALTLGGLLAETSALHPEREAVVFPGPPFPMRWTYRELHGEARRLARSLLALGLPKGGRVGVLLGSRPEWVAAAFGVALAGGVLVPLNTFLEPPELEHVLGHADVALVLTQTRLAGRSHSEELVALCPGLLTAPTGGLQSARLPYLRRVVCLGLEEAAGAMAPWEAFLAAGESLAGKVLDAAIEQVAPADDAVVVYTSGTTAQPKGVLHSHRAPALQSWRFARALGLGPQDRVWSAFPLFWTAGFSMVMGATLAAGACLVLQEQFESGPALRLLEAERVTCAHGWPHQLARLEEHPDWETTDLSSLRHVEAISPFARHKTVRVAAAWSPRAAYGLSETFTIVSSTPADAPDEDRAGHQGPILPGNAVRILDPETGEPQDAGADGLIAVKGQTLMKGYLKVLPEECFDADGFFRTGDAGFVDEQGRLHWTGRTSELIKTGGANVSPVEVETALLAHPGLKAALVVGVPDPRLGDIVVVCAVARDGVALDEKDVRGFLRGRVAAYKLPRRVLFFAEEQLSLTANAKIRTEALRALALERIATG